MAIEKHLTTKDYTVTNEKFDLLWDDRIDLLITHPKPKKEDLGKYYESEDYISHHDQKKSITDILYRIVKKKTIKDKVDLINSLQIENKNILDIGCGTGDFLQACQQNGWKVTGIEPNKKASGLAKEKLNKNTYIYSDVHAFFEEDYAAEEKNSDFKESYKHTKLYFHNEHATKNVEEEVLKFDDKEELNENPYQFDVITMWHVLEHVYDLDAYIYKLKSLLKPNGVLIIAVPNFKSEDANIYKNHWAAYDTPRHLWHFSQTAIHRLFSTELMKVVNTIPMKFDAYYVSLLSEKNKTGKSNFIKAFLNGYRSNQKAKQSGEYSSLIYVIKNMKN